VHDEDVNGNYPQAVGLAVGAGPTSATGPFNELDKHLADAITDADQVFSVQAKAAAAGFALAAPGLIVLTLLMLAGVVAGIQQRIAEYR
jgi:hypothetical protein